jgi:hypothetical protein
MDKHTPMTRQIIYCNTGIYRKTWCGPYAIATICGTEYEPAYRIARAVRGKRHAKGITNTDLERSCKQLGVTGKWHPISSVGAGTKKKMKLKNFLPMLLPNKVFVIQITKHFLVVDTRDFTTIDNQNPEAWLPMEMSPHLTKLVHNYFVVDNPKFDPKSDDTWLIEPLAASS